MTICQNCWMRSCAATHQPKYHLDLCGGNVLPEEQMNKINNSVGFLSWPCSWVDVSRSGPKRIFKQRPTPCLRLEGKPLFPACTIDQIFDIFLLSDLCESHSNRPNLIIHWTSHLKLTVTNHCNDAYQMSLNTTTT